MCVLVLVSALFGSKMLFVMGLRASNVANTEPVNLAAAARQIAHWSAVCSTKGTVRPIRRLPRVMTNTLVGGASGGPTMTGGKSNPKLKQSQQHQHRGSILAVSSSLPPNNGSSPGLSPSMPPGRLLSSPATGRNGMSSRAFGSPGLHTAPLSVNGLSPMRRASNNATAAGNEGTSAVAGQDGDGMSALSIPVAAASSWPLRAKCKQLSKLISLTAGVSQQGSALTVPAIAKAAVAAATDDPDASSYLLDEQRHLVTESSVTCTAPAVAAIQWQQ